eukprot:759041-Hanusia_phi.AAC.2
MLANNETGTVNDIRSIAQIARSKGVLVHTDASQAIGKIPVDVNDLAVDFLTIAGNLSAPVPNEPFVTIVTRSQALCTSWGWRLLYARSRTRKGKKSRHREHDV